MTMMRLHKQTGPSPKKLSGFMMLEVLVALLVFALGVLGLVGLQATAVKQSGEAKYRSDAALLANELIGNAWASNRSFATLQNNFASANAGAQYQAWLARVSQTLPGVAANPPTVAFQQIAPLPSAIDRPAGSGPILIPTVRMTVTVRWAAPGENLGGQPHNVLMITELR